MRKLFTLLAAGMLMVGVASQSSAILLPYSGSLQFGVGAIEPVTLTGGGTAIVNGTGGGGHLFSMFINAGDIAGTASVVVYNAAPISGILFVGGGTTIHLGNSFAYFAVTGSASNGSGGFFNLSNSAANFAGVMPFNGAAIVCLFGPCSGFPGANLAVPISPVGQGGTSIASGAVNITAIGAPWLKNTAIIATSTAMGFQHGPASDATSSAAQGSGVLSLVSPVFVSTSLDAFPVVPSFARFTIHFIPEPGTLLLVGSGIAGLAIIGRRRMKK